MAIAAAGMRTRWRDFVWLEQAGTMLLLSAGVTVAIAIASSGAISRGVNGIAGILWMAAAVCLIASLREESQFARTLAGVMATGFVLVLLVKPSDLAWAMLGFGAAGALIGAFAGLRSLTWAKVLAALWLPEHLATAAAQAIYRAVRDLPANVRTDPPPTAAIVPLSMILFAMAGAWLTREFFRRRAA